MYIHFLMQYGNFSVCPFKPKFPHRVCAFKPKFAHMCVHLSKDFKIYLLFLLKVMSLFCDRNCNGIITSQIQTHSGSDHNMSDLADLISLRGLKRGDIALHWKLGET